MSKVYLYAAEQNLRYLKNIVVWTVLHCNSTHLRGVHPNPFHRLQDNMNVKNVWAIFQSADEFQVQDIRQKSKDLILTEAKTVFATRPLVRDELLEEVFSSNLMCVTDEELLSLLKTWTDPPDQISSQTLVDRWVSMAKTPKRKRGEHSTDLIRCVKGRFDTFSKSQTSQGKSWPKEPSLSRPIFLANWVSVSYALSGDYAPYAHVIAEGNAGCKLQAGDWIEWRLPKFGAQLMGIVFSEVLTQRDHLEIFCAADCSEWQRVFSSKEYGAIYPGFGGNTLVKCRCQHLAQRFKVHMISGEFQLPGIKFQGILAEVPWFHFQSWKAILHLDTHARLCGLRSLKFSDTLRWTLLSALLFQVDENCSGTCSLLNVQSTSEPAIGTEVWMNEFQPKLTQFVGSRLCVDLHAGLAKGRIVQVLLWPAIIEAFVAFHFGIWVFLPSPDKSAPADTQITHWTGLRFSCRQSGGKRFTRWGGQVAVTPSKFDFQTLSYHPRNSIALSTAPHGPQVNRSSTQPGVQGGI